MKNKVQFLFAICFIFLSLFVNHSQSFAKDKLIKLPAVTGTITSDKGEPVQYGLIVVTVLGSHQEASTQFGDIFKLSVTHDMTDENGQFTINSENISLVDALGEKAYLVGCRIEITCSDYKDLRLDIANPSDSSSGIISIFLDSAINHNGSFFGSIAAGFNAVKTNSFIPHYQKALSEKPLIMTPANVIDDQGDLTPDSSINSKINRFYSLYKD